MYDFQEQLITNFHENRFNIAKLPRQTGKSTTVISYLLHYAVFNDNIKIAILANKAETSRELLSRLQLAYENLPKWMQQGIIAWNKGSMELDNGSKIIAASTSSSAVRGNSFNIIFLDEFAFVPNHMAEQFFSSVYPTISSGKTTKVIIISTPNGMNMFYSCGMMLSAIRTVMCRLKFTGAQFLAEMLNGRRRRLEIPPKDSLRKNLNVSSWDRLILLSQHLNYAQWFMMIQFTPIKDCLFTKKLNRIMIIS